jgi:hypothetical protein
VTQDAKIAFVHRRGPTRYWLPEIMAGGVAWIDYDRDGRLDLYLVQAGDLAAPSADAANVLYRNVGDGTFDDVTAQAGVGDIHYGMGAAVGDFDADGCDDLYVTNVGPNVLYRNRGWTCRLGDVGGISGLRSGRRPGPVCGQLHPLVAPDRRGLPQRRSSARLLFASSVSSIHIRRPVSQPGNDQTPNHLWLQDSAGKFREVGLQAGCSLSRTGATQAGMGVAAVDIEDDGDLDLFVTNLGNETNTLYLTMRVFSRIKRIWQVWQPPACR